MIRLYVIIFFHVITSGFAQDTIPKYWIGFVDKANSSFDISLPENYLSERALLRRQKQGITIDSLDLPVSDIYVDSVVKFGSVTLHNTSKWLNGIVVGITDTIALDSILNYGFVSQFVRLKHQFIDNDKKLEPELNTKNLIEVAVSPYPYGYSYNQLSIHGADKLQDLGFRGQGIHIAILDAGFLMVDQTPGLSHLFEESKILSTYDFVRKETSVYEDHYHGAAVLSIIAGKVPGDYMGSAYESYFHLLISEDVFSESLVEEYYWVSAAEYADSAGVDIINTSLGYTQFDDSTQNHTYTELTGNVTPAAMGSNIASSKGILCVTSAGNSGSSAWKYISTPADADSILTVGAINTEGVRADFSSVGPTADGDVKPNVMAVGWDTYFLAPSSGEILTGNGTSFSAPMMTGMSACLWQALPNLTNMELLHMIENSSHMYSSPDSLMGYGIPNVFDVYKNATGIIYEEYSDSKIQMVFPNPFSTDLNVLYQSSDNQEVEIYIYDVLGKVIYFSKVSINSGLNRIQLSTITEITPGCYFISIGNSLAKIVKDLN